MTDINKLKALAEAFPADLDFDTNTTPFFNGPDGESLGGESTGYCSVYGQPFDIDGEQYDGTEYVSICTKEFAEFVCSARDGVLQLIAEIERLEARNAAQMRVNASQRQRRKEWVERAGKAEDEAIDAEEVRDQLKTENIDLHATLQAAKGEIERLKGESEALRKALITIREESHDIGACECAADALVDSRKEVSHG